MPTSVASGSARSEGAFFLLLLTILTAWGCDRRSVPPEATVSDASSSKSESQPEQSAALPSGSWRGVCLAHNWQHGGVRGYGTAESQETLEHLQGVGVEWLSLTPFGWMKSQQASSITGEHTEAIPGAGETRARVVEQVEQARTLGLAIMLKPHIWISGGAWRGELQPRDEQGALAWADWWSSYRAFILYYARMAQELEVDALVVGVELVSALRHDPDAFLRVVEAVRGVYQGPLLYSANWDEGVPDRVWRALDRVGVQLYPPLSQELRPSLSTLRQRLRGHLDRWSSLAERVERPLVLTEVGYRSAPGATVRPFTWPERLPPEERVPDLAIQKLAYQALFLELARVEKLGGVFLWKYFTDPSIDEEGPFGFSPRGKPAEQVLEQAFGRP